MGKFEVLPSGFLALKDIGNRVGEVLIDGAKEHPVAAIAVTGGVAFGLGSVYILKDKEISFKMKNGDTEYEFSSK